MIGLTIALFIPFVLGFLLITIILRESEEGLIDRLCLSYPVGMGLLTMQMFLLGILKVPLTLTYTSIPIFIEIAVLSIWMWKKKV